MEQLQKENAELRTESERLAKELQQSVLQAKEAELSCRELSGQVRSLEAQVGTTQLSAFLLPLPCCKSWPTSPCFSPAGIRRPAASGARQVPGPQGHAEGTGELPPKSLRPQHRQPGPQPGRGAATQLHQVQCCLVEPPAPLCPPAPRSALVPHPAGKPPARTRTAQPCQMAQSHARHSGCHGRWSPWRASTSHPSPAARSPSWRAASVLWATSRWSRAAGRARGAAAPRRSSTSP